MLANLVGPNGQVLIFEPEDENFRSAKEESKKYQWVSIDQRGVWSKKGQKSFKIAPPTHPGNHKIPIENTEHPNDYVSSYESTKQIEVAPLDSLLLEYSIDPDHIEITVNGAEYHVLRGSTHTLKEHKPSLWVKGWLQDTRSNRSVTDDIKALLDECNYEIATTKSVVRDDISEIEKVDGDVFAY
jgi:FkbM family methyltransferase